jgi:hypothetical protein
MGVERGETFPLFFYFLKKKTKRRWQFSVNAHMRSKNTDMQKHPRSLAALAEMLK